MRHRFPRHGLAAELSGRVDALRGLSFESACQVLAQWRSAAALPALQALDPAAMSERELAAWQQCLAALGAPLEGDASAPR